MLAVTKPQLAEMFAIINQVVKVLKIACKWYTGFTFQGRKILRLP